LPVLFDNTNALYTHSKPVKPRRGKCLKLQNRTSCWVYDQVLKEFVAAYGPLAIMLEDLHHFDSISWHFLTTVVENLSEQVLVVTTMRPDDGVLAAASRHEEGE